MKILVFSDSHGNSSRMCQVVAREQPDYLIHLGDGWQDVERIQDTFPSLPCIQVAGNCDGAISSPEKLISLENAKLLLCHGHTLGVKCGLLRATYAAREQGADFLLYGHTHRPSIDFFSEVCLVNPGSIGKGKPPTYALLTTKDGTLFPSLHSL